MFWIKKIMAHNNRKLYQPELRRGVAKGGRGPRGWGLNLADQLTFFQTRLGADYAPPPLCVQMDFTRTFEANTKCNNMNHV